MHDRPPTSAGISLLKILAIGALLASCQPTRTPRVQGTVTDDSGTPIQAATVVVEGTDLLTHSDSMGHFLLTGLPDNLSAVVVYAKGYRATHCALAGRLGAGEFRCNVALSLDTARTPPVIE
jgi:hypothetical protein